MNEVVYHYCSVETFFNIVKNSSIWLSDIAKSNDYQECVRCREIVNNEIEEYLRDDVEALKVWRTWYEEGAYSYSSTKTFCVCFSGSKDKLSQWRGYAQDGKGVAIGFDKELLEELNQISEFHIAFGKVLYDNPEEYVQGIIADNIKKFEYKSVGHVALELSENYRMQFPFVKNPGFKEENEWRVVVCSGIGHYNIPSSDNILFSKVKYRTANNKLVPYIEMNFEKVKQNIIKEIFIGPKSEVEVEDVINLLSYYGYYDGIEEEYNSHTPVDIQKSYTTYR
ncbi:MAG TPA: DUF2971 domain-containing protein [Candidatus Mediterraneibacter vanvlietii]|nr:DUF2971 domain-containing protein [Candidatus Mediterraneibacter vanvlietii]